MRESDLSAPVSAWLTAQGYTVYSEVCCGYVTIDLVGYAMGKPSVAIELKRALTRKVVKQCAVNQLYADYSYAAVGTLPRPAGLSRCAELGIGVLSVVNPCVLVLVEPGQAREHQIEHYRTDLELMIPYLTPSGLGGLPGGRIAYAQDVARAVVPLLRAKVPRKEIFRRVPNHYASAASMRNALWGWPKTRAILRTALEPEQTEATA